MQKFLTKRIQNIKKHVSMRQLIDHFNIFAQSQGVITQVRCPFHEYDKHPSARIYETNTMHCFYCSKTWDIVSFIREKNNLQLRDALSFLEDTFNIPKLSLEDMVEEEKGQLKNWEDKKIEEQYEREEKFDNLFDKIKNYLISNKKYFIFEDYVHNFNRYDGLYRMYYNKEYASENDMKVMIESFYKEIYI